MAKLQQITALMRLYSTISKITSLPLHNIITSKYYQVAIAPRCIIYN